MKRTLAVVAVGLLILLLLPGLIASGLRAAARTTATGAAGAQAAALAAAASVAAPKPPAQRAAFNSAQAVKLIDRLQAAAGPVQVEAHLRTGYARFIGLDAELPGFRGVDTGIAGQPQAAGRAFLSEYGSLFGISHAASLKVMSEKSDTGRDYVRYQQTINGIPVLAGEVIVQVDASGRVWSASGESLPDDTVGALPTEPAINAEDAATTALAATVKYEQILAEKLTVSTPQLWYYYPDLLGAPGPTSSNLVWRIEVGAKDLSPVRELVLVDALTGKVPLHFNQVPDAKNRVVYNNNNNGSLPLPGTAPARSEGQGVTGNGDVDKAYDYAGDTYDFYMSRYGRDSIDGKGMQIISTVKYCSGKAGDPCPYPNAFWNGKQMVYGDGYASGDDVVGHELTHGVTNLESNLFYYVQSGALNESLSDIWGEYIDQTNSNDAAGPRWLMGEDIPGGAIRNMANPGQFGDPDSMSSANYKCDTRDNGMVHSNSGVSNRTAVLMTDGGSLNGKSVTGLGLEKSAQIWYRMATELLTSGSEYQDVYNLLPQACMDLATSGVKGITQADCQQVRNAVAATQMNQEAASCASAEAPVCAVGQMATGILNDNFENQQASLGSWVSGSSFNPNIWYYPQTNNPYSYPMYYASSGLYHLWGDDVDTPSDGWMQMKNGVTVPTTGAPYFRFRHAFGFESDLGGNYDAGVLEYSANGGPWTDAGALFVDNGYNGPIDGNPHNPLYGRNGFVDVSWGYGSSRLNLSSLMGQSVKFRFRIASDEQLGDWGWFVDDVLLYSCATASTPTPTPTRNPNLKPALYLPMVRR